MMTHGTQTVSAFPFHPHYHHVTWWENTHLASWGTLAGDQDTLTSSFPVSGPSSYTMVAARHTQMSGGDRRCPEAVVVGSQLHSPSLSLKPLSPPSQDPAKELMLRPVVSYHFNPSLNWGPAWATYKPMFLLAACPDPPVQVSGPFCPPDPEFRLHLGRVEVTGILPSSPAPYSHPATAALTEGKESSPHSPPPTQLCRSVREGATGGALRR